MSLRIARMMVLCAAVLAVAAPSFAQVSTGRIDAAIVDRVNVGGAESGQQSSYMAKGATGADNTWNIDGIAVTDMAATGSTPTYYDFDMFQEMQVSTGGADISSVTPGVQLNMVLKS